jgi:cytidylate kinase
MAVIVISRASYSHSTEIAERVAQELNYRCVSKEVISLASQEFDIPENYLRQAIEKAPSILDRFSFAKKKYVAYVRSALLEYVAEDNLVYHGLAGHILLLGLPNILRVMISATLEERVKVLMRRENVTEKEAIKAIEKFDKERRKWAMYFHGKDPWDLSMYDFGVVIGRLTIDDAVKKIINAVQLPSFKMTPELRQIINNESLAAKIKSDLMNFYHDVEVTVEDQTVVVHIQRSLKQEEAITEDIREILMEMHNIKDVRLNITPV